MTTTKWVRNGTGYARKFSARDAEGVLHEMYLPTATVDTLGHLLTKDVRSISSEEFDAVYNNCPILKNLVAKGVIIVTDECPDDCKEVTQQVSTLTEENTRLANELAKTRAALNVSDSSLKAENDALKEEIIKLREAQKVTTPLDEESASGASSEAAGDTSGAEN